MPRFTKDFPERPMTQLNLRVSPYTADAFRAYCREHRLTQNEALAVLLSGRHFDEQDSAEAAYLEELHRYQTTITEVTDKYEALQEKQKTREESDWQKARSWAKIMNKLLDYVIERAELGEPPAKKKYFKRDHNRVGFHKYRTPPGSGCVVVRLDALLYGQSIHPPLFLLTTHIVEEDGSEELLKFRYYPRARFVGVPPGATKYSCPGSLWAIGYIPASDGAAEVLAALPLDAITQSSTLLKALHPDAPKSGLDLLIEDIERRRKKNLL